MDEERERELDAYWTRVLADVPPFTPQVLDQLADLLGGSVDQGNTTTPDTHKEAS